MGIFKRAHVRGMTHELTRQGLISWPSKFAEEEAADAIADNLSEEELPEVSPEEGLTPEQAKAVLDQIVEVAQTINEHVDPEGVSPEDEELNKLSAAFSYEEAAAASTYTLMQKVAEESSTSAGPTIPGETKPVPELGSTAEGEVDAKNYPSTEYTGPQGETSFDTAAGEVGQQIRREQQPGTQESSPNNKLAGVLAHLKAAMDGASLSGGPAGGPTPAARKDLPDNLKIPGAVAPRMGVSSQNVPASAVVGTAMPHPAGEPGASAPVNNQLVAKQAMDLLLSTEEGRDQLRQISKIGAALL